MFRLKIIANIARVSIALGICVLAFVGCGKVTQQVSTAKESPSFTLFFSVDNLFLPSSKFHETALLMKGASKRNFDHLSPIHVVVEGVSDKKTKQLAWSKVQLRRNETISKDKKTLFSYTSKVTDLKNIEVKSTAKQSQIKTVYDSKKSQLSFQAPKLSYDYDYYLISAFSSDQAYQFQVIPIEEVSKNAKVTAEPMSDFITFRALQFLKVNDSMLLSQKMYNQFLLLVDEALFDSLDYSFPSYQLKSFNEKKPYFIFDDELTNRLSEFIEIAFIDIDECKALLETDELLTADQKKVFLENLKLLAKE